MKKLNLLFIALTLSFATFNQVKATSYSANATGTWSTTTIWTPTAPTGGPGSGDNVTIPTGLTVTLGAAQSCNNITLTGTAKVGIAAWTLTVYGSVSGSGNFGNADYGTVILAGTGQTISGTISTAFANNSNVSITGTYSISSGASFSVPSAGAYYVNVTIANNFTNNGTFTIGTPSVSNSTLLVNSGMTLTNAANAVLNLYNHTNTFTGSLNATASGNTVTYGNTAAAQTIYPTTYYNLTINESGQTGTLGGAATVSGALNVAAGTFAISGQNVTVNGSTSIGSSATLLNNGSGTRNFNGDFIISGTYNSNNGTQSFGGNFTNNGTLTNSNGYTYFTGSGKTMSGTGGLNFATSSEFFISSGANITASGTFQGRDVTINGYLKVINGFTSANSGPIMGSNATLEINGGTVTGAGSGLNCTSNTPNLVEYTSTSAGQTMYSSTYYNLLINNTGQIATLPASLSVNNNLSILSGSTLADNAKVLTVKGTVTNYGTHSGTGSITLGNSGPQTVFGTGTYGNLILSNGSTTSFSAAQNINGGLTISSSNTLADGGNTISVKGTVTNNGTHVSSGSGSLTLIGAAGQSLTGATGAIYGNLTFNSGSSITVGGGTYTVNGTLTINSGTSVDNNPTINIYGNVVNNGAFIKDHGIPTFTGTGAQTISGNGIWIKITNNNTSGGVTLSSGSSITQTALGGEIPGNLIFTNNGLFTNSGTITNYGTSVNLIQNTTGSTFAMTCGANVSAPGTVAGLIANNSATSKITGPSAGIATFTTGGAVSNSGSIGKDAVSGSGLCFSNTITGGTVGSNVGTNCNKIATCSSTPVVTITPASPTICSGATVSLTALATGGSGTYSTYAWSTGTSPNNASVTAVTPSTSTVYTVTVTDNASNTGSASVTVTVNTTPTASASATPATICAGSSTILSAWANGGSGYTYAWSTGGCGGSVASCNPIPAISSTYTVTITSSGCTATNSTTVTVNPVPTPSAGSNSPICAGNSLNVTAAGAYSSYVWTGPNSFNSSGSSATVNVTNNAQSANAGTYYVTVTNSSNCSATGSTVVSVGTVPTVNITGTSQVCSSTNPTLTATVTGGTPNYTYYWSSNPAGYTATSSSTSSTTYSVVPTAITQNTSYTVSVSDACGNSGTYQYIVSLKPSPTVAITGTAAVCSGTSTNLTATVTGSTPNYIYYWTASSGGYTSTSGSTSATVYSVTPTAITQQTTYTVSITDACSQTAFNTYQVSINPLPTANAQSSAGSSSLCYGSLVTLSANAGGGAGGYGYVWSATSGSANPAASANPTTNPTVNVTYTVTVSDANNCKVTSSVSVGVIKITVSVASSVSSVCSASNVTLSSTPSGGSGYSYSWSSNPTGFSATAQNPTVSVSSTTTYIVSVTDVASGCGNTAQTVITYGSSGNTITSNAITGNWNSTATWVGGIVPGACDNVNIVNGATVSLTAPALSNNLTIAGTFQDGGNTLTVNGNYLLNGTHTSTGSGAIILSGSSFTALQKITYSSGTFGSLIINNNASLSSATSITFPANLTVNAGYMFYDNGQNITVNGGYAVTNNGTIGGSSSGMVSLNNNTTITGTGYYNNVFTPDWSNQTFYVTNNININGNLTIGGGNQLVIGANTCTVAGNVHLDQQGYFTTSGGGTLVMTGASTSFYNNNMYGGATGGNLKINGNVSFTGDLSYTLSSLEINGNATLNPGSSGSSLIINGNFSIDNGKTFSDNGNTFTVKGNVTNNGTHSGSGSITLAASVPQAILGTGTYGDMVLNNGNITSCSAAQTINGYLTINSGNTLADGGNTITVKGTITATGNHVSGAGGSITMAGAGGQQINPATNAILGNLTLNNGSTIVVGGGTFYINGTLTINTGTSVNNSPLMYLKGNVVNNGAFITNHGIPDFIGTGAQTITGNGVWIKLQNDNTGSGVTLTSGSSVTFTALGGEIIANLIFTNNATFTNSGTITHYGTAINQFLNSGTFVMNCGANVTIPGTTTGILTNAGSKSITGPSIGLATFVTGGVVSNNGSIGSDAVNGSGLCFSNTITGGTIGSAVLQSCNSVATCSNNPMIAISPSSPSICNGSSVTLTAAVSKGTPPYTTYAWSVGTSPNNTSVTSVSPNANTTYTVTVTDNVGNTGVGQVIVTVKAVPTATAGYTNASSICQGQSISLTAYDGGLGSSSYAWSGPDSYSSTSQNPGFTATATAYTGSYTVTVTKNSCTSTAITPLITVNSLPTASQGSNSPVCAGSNLNLTAANSYSTYTWTGPNGFTGGTYNPTITGATTAATGTYYVTVTNGSGCTVSASTAVTVNALPTASAGYTNASSICQGGTISLTANDGGLGSSSYAWSGPNSYTSAIQNPNFAATATAYTGSYTVTVTKNSCTSTAVTSVVTVNANPTATASASAYDACSSFKNITLSASGSYTSYSWSSNPSGFSSIQQNPTVNITQTTTYTVTVTNAGCNNTSNVVITYNAGGSNITQAQAGNWNSTSTWTGGVIPGACDNVTLNNNVTLTANAACNNFLIGSSNNLALGNYNLTIYGSQIGIACYNNATFTSTGGYMIIDGTINANTNMTASGNCQITIPYLALANNTNLSLGNGGWGTLITNSFLCNSGNSSLTYIGGSYTGGSVPAFTGATINAPNCTFNVTSPNANGFDFSGAANNVVIGGLNMNQSGTTFKFAGTQAVTINNTLAFTVAASFTSPGTFIMNTNSTLNITSPLTVTNLTLGGAGVVKNGSSTLTATTFNPNNQTNFNISQGVLAVTNNFTIPSVMTFTNNGTLRESGALTNSGSLLIPCSAQVITTGSFSNTGTITGSSTTGAYGVLTLNGSVSNSGNICTDGSYLACNTNLTAGGGSVGTHVKQSSTILPTCTPFTTVTITPSTTTICNGTSAVLTAAPGNGTASFTYAWASTPGSFSGFTAIVTVSPSVSTTYTVIVADANNIPVTQTQAIIVDPTPVISINTSQTVCNGTAITISTAQTGTTYAWSASTGTVPSGQSSSVSPSTTATYRLTVTSNGLGCTAAPLTVTVNPLPTITAGNSGASNICNGSSAAITAFGTSITGYTWSNSLGIGATKTVNPTITTTYSVTGTNGTCPNTAQAIVTVHGTGAVTQTTVNNGDWNTASTWSSGMVPLPCDNVVINNNVSISAGVTVTCVNFTNNSNFSNNGTILVSGNYSNTGSFTANCGTIVITQGNFTNGGTITGPSSAGKYARFETNGSNANSGIIGYNNTNLSFDNAIWAGGTILYNVKFPSNILQTCNSITVVSITASQTSICNGTSITFTANASAGTAPYSYSWSGGASQSSSVNSDIPTTSTTYTVTVTDANNIPVIQTLEITVHGGTVTSIHSTDWNTPSTWDNNDIPMSCDNIVIANDVTIIAGANVACVNLTINTSSTLSSTTGSLSIGGNLINNGLFVNNNGTVVFNGNTTVSGSSTTGFDNVTNSGVLTGHATNMNVAGNWTNNGTYNNNTGKVTFNGNSHYNGSSTTNFYNVDVAAGKLLTIDGGSKTMQVTNQIYLLTTGPKNMGQLSIADNTSQLSGTGGSDTVYVQLYDTLGNWHYQGVPSSFYTPGCAYGNTTCETSAIVLYDFYGQRFVETSNAYTSLTGFDPLQVGRGYAIKFNATLLGDPQRLTNFKSPISYLNTGTISYPLTYTVGKGTGWNLVSNPYPCAIDWGYNTSDATHTTNGWHCSSNVEPTIYIYDSQNSQYITYNSYTGQNTNGDANSRYIAPMQGVYVHLTTRSTNGTGLWSMDNGVRLAYNQAFFKGEENTNPPAANILNLYVSGNGYSDQSVIGFTQDATTGFDGNYDAYKLLSSSPKTPQIYTLDSAGTKLAVNYLPSSLMNQVTVPLNFAVGVSGTYTITAGNVNINPAVAITLEDLKTKKLTDLNSSSYIFTSDTATNDGRFLVHFGPVPTSVNDKNYANNLNIYTNHNQIVIQNNSSSTEKGTILIYDMLGRLIVNQYMEPNAITRIDMTETNESQAIYFVKVITSNQTLTRKVCVTK